MGEMSRLRDGVAAVANTVEHNFSSESSTGKARLSPQTGSSSAVRRRVGHGTAAPGAVGPVVAIVGAGFSGTMAAIQLRKLLPRDHVVCLFDRTGRFARCPAYAASGEPYLLNVRAANMSAFPDQPDHFRDWLERNEGLLPGDVARTEVGLFRHTAALWPLPAAVAIPRDE